MKDGNRCSSREANAGCHSVQEIQTVQPFPDRGQLGRNLGLPLPFLTARIGKLKGRAYSYVVSTVAWDQETAIFEQYGSAPNFQGNHLTICTCKHQMRSRLSTEEWESDVWIAGFTSRSIHMSKHWLFFLAKVDTAHDSHTDLWDSMDAESRRQKAAHLHYLGDLFKPIAPKPMGHERFSPHRYVMPVVHAHRQYSGHSSWKKDINYRHATTFSRPPLLVANPRLTFLWKEPMVYFAQKKHCRDYLKWSSIHELLAQLRQAS